MLHADLGTYIASGLRRFHFHIALRNAAMAKFTVAFQTQPDLGKRVLYALQMVVSMI